MHIPNFLIALPCLFAFLLSLIRYYQADPLNRFTDRRFLTACAAIVTLIANVATRARWPGEPRFAPAFLLLALCLLGYAVWLLRAPLHPPKAAAPATKSG